MSHPRGFPLVRDNLSCRFIVLLEESKQLDYLEENLGVLRLGHPPLNENYKQAPLLLHGKREFLSRRDTPAQPKEELFEKISKARAGNLNLHITIMNLLGDETIH